jgi:hypothetical protein
VTHSNSDTKGSLLSKSMSGHGNKMRRGDEKRKSDTCRLERGGSSGMFNSFFLLTPHFFSPETCSELDIGWSSIIMSSEREIAIELEEGDCTHSRGHQQSQLLRALRRPSQLLCSRVGMIRGRRVPRQTSQVGKCSPMASQR